jgi:hypothetical protein
MSFVIYSDMIKTTNMNRVVLAVSKIIAFNLKIRDVFNPISVIKDSDRYFYTTAEFDSEAIRSFTMKNSAGNMNKPCNGEIALVSHWNNPNTDDVWKYRKELSNRAVLARGMDIKYDDLSMFMTCAIRYIELPQKPDGTINVTIVDYIESLDLFIRDGFGTLVGVLIHSIKTKSPNAKIDLYFEIDPTSLPSPCIYRYIKNNFVRPVDVNPNINHFNTIIEKIAAQNGVQPTKIPVEGEPFDSPEYKTNSWKTFSLTPENRRFVSDDQRIDWRFFGRKAFPNTLGEKFKDYKNMDINDKSVRQNIMNKLGYQPTLQPQVIKAIVIKDFCKSALMAVINSCGGFFSISQYIAANRSMVVDDNYMMNGSLNQQYTQSPNMNPYMQQQPNFQFNNGGYQQNPQQQNPMFQSFNDLIAKSRASQNK